MNRRLNLKHIALIFFGIFLINYIGSYFYKRFDLTNDKRFTLSKTTIDLVKNTKEPLTIKVYLKGNFPAEFKRLQIETKQLLQEFKALNSNIRFRFINPKKITKKLISEGMIPSRLQVEEEGKISELVVFPWASIQYGKKKENVELLISNFNTNQDDQMQQSIQNLEYAFTNAIYKITSPKIKKIAVLKGNGELNDVYLFDYLNTINKHYRLAPFTLDSVTQFPKKTFKELQKFDAIIVAKPTQKFTEAEKYTLDQYLISGGKALWLIDNVTAEMDSLYATGKTLAFPKDLGLTDLFFSYGFRINPNLIEDLYSSKIAVATGNIGGKTKYNQFLWKYFPLVNPSQNHPISKGVNLVNLQFANSIDLLKNKIKKTILLQSSKLSKTIATPHFITLNSLAEKPNPKTFNNGSKPMAVLLEGSFTSAYKNRVKPINLNTHNDQKIASKLIVISDGDIIANKLNAQGEPYPLGFDKWSNQTWGNKMFLLNAMHYLLDDQGIMQLRSKNISIPLLNKEKAFTESRIWQLINIALPLVFLAIFAFIFHYFRKQKYLN